MKTVWHWKNIGKAWLAVLASTILFAVIAVAIDLPNEIAMLLGVVVGWCAMTFSATKWDLWHFEWVIND